MVSRVKGKRQSNKRNIDFAQVICTEMDIAAFCYCLHHSWLATAQNEAEDTAEVITDRK